MCPSDAVVQAAVNAAFPGLPPGMALGEAERRVRAALEAAAAMNPPICPEPCCAEARERKAAWAEYMSLVRLVVRARTGQRIVGREPGCPPTR